MGIRGRPSGAEIAVISGSGIVAIHRPEAPDDLTDEQSDEWRQVVNRLPADWFPRETHGMLAQYCRHVVTARRVAQLVQLCEAAKELDLGQYDKLLKMQEREGRAISSLATRMRISQHSTYAKDKKRGAVLTQKPWEVADSRRA